MRRVALAAAALALAFAVFVAPHARSQGPPLRDFEAYYAAGSTWFYHGDVYGRDIWRAERTVPSVDAERDEFLPFVGPAYGLPIWAALAALSFPVAALVWGTMLALGLGVLIAASLWLAQARPTVDRVLAALLFAGAFAPITGGFGLGQVALPACAAIAAFPLTLRRRGTYLAIASTLVAGLQPNLAIALLVRASDGRARLALVLGACFATFASAVALGGLAGLGHYLTVLREHGAAERFIAIQTTPAAVARALGATPEVASRLGIGVAAIVALVLLAQLRRRTSSPDTRLVLTCAALPLLLPFAHEHDFAIAFAPAIVVLARARGWLWIAGATAAVGLGIDWLGLVQRPHEIAATLGFLVAGGCAALALAPERPTARHLLPLLWVPVITVLAILVARHPVPIWPDALPPQFHVAPTVPAPVVWYAEQRAAGIATPNPASGILRGLELVVCAALWIVANVTLSERRARHAEALDA